MNFAALLFPVISLCGNNLSTCSASSRLDSPGRFDESNQVRLLHQAAVMQEAAGRWEQAAASYRDEISALDRLGKPGKIISAEIYISLAGIYQIAGRLESAETAYKLSVSLMKQYRPENGPSDPMTLARAWEGLYWLYTEWGRLDDAAAALNNGYRVADKILPQASAERIAFLDSRGVLLCASGHYAEAEREWKHALDIGQANFPGNEVPYRAVLTHLGQMYSRIGEYDSAGDFLQRSLAAHADPNDSATISQAVLRSELAAVYMHTKRVPDAESLFAQAMKVADAVGSKVPIATSLIVSRFGDFQMLRRRWSDAENCYRRALDLRLKVLGDHKMVAESFFALSRALDKLHRKADARNCRDRAGQILAAQKTPDFTRQTVDVLSFRAHN